MEYSSGDIVWRLVAVLALAFAIITALHIVLGELAPKTIALERPESTALWVVKPTELFMKGFWPFIRLLNGTGRVVVIRTNLDNVVGILHLRDVVRALANGVSSLNPGALAREGLTVPVTLAADDVLAAMRRRGVQEAIVIDEYGGTAGLVTFESLMERIVGDLGAVGGGRISVRPDGSADIDGLTLVTDANE